VGGAAVRGGDPKDRPPAEHLDAVRLRGKPPRNAPSARAERPVARRAKPGCPQVAPPAPGGWPRDFFGASASAATRKQGAEKVASRPAEPAGHGLPGSKDRCGWGAAPSSRGRRSAKALVYLTGEGLRSARALVHLTGGAAARSAKPLVDITGEATGAPPRR